jgi:hypothetical protein
LLSTQREKEGKKKRKSGGKKYKEGEWREISVI